MNLPVRHDKVGDHNNKSHEDHQMNGNVSIDQAVKNS